MLINKKNGKFGKSMLLLGLLLVLSMNNGLNHSFFPKKTLAASVYGDWVISSEVVRENEVIEINGSIIVTSSGNLTLRNVTLIFMMDTYSANDGEYNITLQSGAEIHIIDSVLKTENLNKTTYFNATETGALVQISNSSFYNFGDVTQPAFMLSQLDNRSYIEDSYINSTSEKAYVIELSNTQNFRLERSIIIGDFGVKVVDNDGIITLRNNTVKFRKDVGIYLKNNTNLEVSGSTILSENFTGLFCFGIYHIGASTDVSNSTIIKNNYISNSVGGNLVYGMYSSVYNGIHNDSLQIIGNVINNSYYGIYLKDLNGKLSVQINFMV